MENERRSLKLREVHTTAGGFHLGDISLELAPGEYFVLLGPTGAGKTTLLETIASLRPLQRGEIRLGPTPLHLLPPEKRPCGFVYQDYALFPHLNVRQNIAFGLRVRRLPARQITQWVEEVATLLGITHLLKRRLAGLSGGKRQRVALARVLVLQPQVLLLDEPLSALDTATREELGPKLRQVHEVSGCLTIHVTHDFAEARYLADRVGIIDQGRLLQAGPPKEFFARPSSLQVARFVAGRWPAAGRP